MATTTDVIVTTEGFEEFISKLDRLKKGGLVDQGFKEYVEHVRNVVIEGTPVGDEESDEHPGLMKKSWENPVYNTSSSNLQATITNSTDYGYYSNYGHYQTVGLYVPAINAKLIHEYVPGTYALETSLQDAEFDFESIIKPEILAIWNDYQESTDRYGNKYTTVRQSYYDRPGEELQ